MLFEKAKAYLYADGFTIANEVLDAAHPRHRPRSAQANGTGQWGNIPIVAREGD